MMPRYIDLEEVGIDVDLGATITAILILPLAGAIDKAYKKAAELKAIDVSKLVENPEEEPSSDEPK